MYIDSDTTKKTIMDVQTINNEMHIIYLDGHENVEPYSKHNLEVYRSRMEEQMKCIIKDYHNYALFDYRLNKVKKISTLIFDISFIYFIYNIPEQVVLKLILILLTIIYNLYLIKQNIKRIMRKGFVLSRLVALDYYIKHKEEFEYINAITHEKTQAIQIEEINRYQLGINELKLITNHIKEEHEKGKEELEPFFGVIRLDQLLSMEEVLKKTK